MMALRRPHETPRVVARIVSPQMSPCYQNL